MPEDRQATNRVKTRRVERRWSQDELAQRAGISRAAVSAIEISRLVPSVAAALALARVLECSVEDLFGDEQKPQADPLWAWTPPQSSCRYWHASVGGRKLLYPVEMSFAGFEHDGLYANGTLRGHSRFSPEQTLVLASCDPAAGLLAGEIQRQSGMRVLVLPRSSQQAIALLGEGLVHVAGLHLATARNPDENRKVVRDRLGAGFCLLRVARWQDGLALSSGSGASSVRQALAAKMRWVGRQPGSGARQCQDELLHGRAAPRHTALDHGGVAEAIRSGWADAGICLRLVSEETGLRFLSVREEIYELCFAAGSEHDPRIRALKEVVRAASYPKLLDDLPGYRAAECGELQTVL